MGGEREKKWLDFSSRFGRAKKISPFTVAGWWDRSAVKLKSDRDRGAEIGSPERGPNLHCQVSL